MEIRDVLYGLIDVTDAEVAVIDSPFFQRLRNIKQLGFSENSFPGATHNRYTHSLGALHLAGVVFDQVFKSCEFKSKYPEDAKRLRQALRLAAMLHDVGHGPLSHTTEFAMPPVQKLGLEVVACIPGKPCSFTESRQANHEDYTTKIILQSSMSAVLEKAFKSDGILPIHIAGIINDSIYVPDDFFVVDKVDYRPILHQMVSSELDVDRMDYLSRDSYYAGVSYGKFDMTWLLSNLMHHVQDGKCFLALNHRAILTFDDFLVSRFHMFLMVYFHHKSVIFDELLGRFLRAKDCDYSITNDIEQYIYYDDYHLYTHLGKSKNEWGKRVFHKTPYKVFAEFHSGMPMGEKHQHEQTRKIEKIIASLQSDRVDFIIKTTTGELSKYFKKDADKAANSPIYVSYDDRRSKPQFIPLEECTDLFKRYPESRSITRIYTP